jgi:1-acyl-sn-glycerol-3-phosphate acyltransferase
LLPGRPGAALIALKACVPIVPCYVRGSPFSKNLVRPLIMPAKVELKIGRPIDLSEFYGREGEREVLEEITRRMLREMAALAGCPDFQPELAGRFYKPGLGRPLPPPGEPTILGMSAGTPCSQTRQLP